MMKESLKEFRHLLFFSLPLGGKVAPKGPDEGAGFGQLVGRDDSACRFAGVSPCGARYFPNDGKVPKGSPGDGSGWTLRVHIRLTPGPPLRGTRTCKVKRNFRRAKSEWLV